MSSSGEMKTSLKLMIWRENERDRGEKKRETDVLMLNMLEKLELAVSSLAEYGSAEGLHDLLDRDGGASQLVLG